MSANTIQGQCVVCGRTVRLGKVRGGMIVHLPLGAVHSPGPCFDALVAAQAKAREALRDGWVVKGGAKR